MTIDKYTNLFNHHTECLKQAFVDLNLAMAEDEALTDFMQGRVLYRYEHALEYAFKSMQSFIAIQDEFELDYEKIISKAKYYHLIENEDIWHQMLADSNLQDHCCKKIDDKRIQSAINGEYSRQIKLLIERL